MDPSLYSPVQGPSLTYQALEEKTGLLVIAYLSPSCKLEAVTCRSLAFYTATTEIRCDSKI